MNTPETALLTALRASPLAKDLTMAQTEVLGGIVRLEGFRHGDVLAGEGAVDDRLLVVVDGSLGVVRHAGTPDETLLATLTAGDLAHELGFLDGTPRYASLLAAGDTRVLVLERAGLETLVDAHPRILYAVMCAIVRAVHRVQTRLSMQASELTNYVVKQHGRY